MGVNTMMTTFEEVMPRLLQQEVIGTKLAEPSPASTSSVTTTRTRATRWTTNSFRTGSWSAPRPTRPIDELWRLVKAHDYVIGDFTWTGWDYLGEVGVGTVEFRPAAGGVPTFLGRYPWLTARTGDIDITGHRRAISYYREIVFGLRREPFVAVESPSFSESADGAEPVVDDRSRKLDLAGTG